MMSNKSGLSDLSASMELLDVKIGGSADSAGRRLQQHVFEMDPSSLQISLSPERGGLDVIDIPPSFAQLTANQIIIT